MFSMHETLIRELRSPSRKLKILKKKNKMEIPEIKNKISETKKFTEWT